MSLNIYSTLDGSAYADAIGLGGADAGIDLGAAIRGEDSQVRHLFLQHSFTNKIYDVRLYLSAYSGNWGGTVNASAAADLAEILVWGGTTDEGIRLELNRVGSGYHTEFKVGVGDSLANAIGIGAACQCYNNAGEQAASSPTSGQVGPAANTTLGDAAHLRLIFTPPIADDTGIRDVDIRVAYTRTT